MRVFLPTLGIHMENELLYCEIENRTPCLSSFFILYSRTSMARTPLGLGKLVRDRGSSMRVDYSARSGRFIGTF